LSRLLTSRISSISRPVYRFSSNFSLLSFQVNQFSSVRRQFSTDGASGDRELGTVKWFDSSKGFGFITRSDGTDIFVHFSGIIGDGYRSLEEGQKVEFVVTQGPKGPGANEVVIKDASGAIPRARSPIRPRVGGDRPPRRRDDQGNEPNQNQS